MAFKLDSFLIGILIFSLFMVGMALVIIDLDNNYNDVSIDTTLIDDNVYNVYPQLNTTTQNAKEEVLGGDTDTSNAENSLFGGANKALRLIESSFSIIGDILNKIAVQLGIPQFIINFVIVGITLMLVFAIIYLIFRVRS